MKKINWSNPELINLSGQMAYGNCLGSGSVATLPNNDTGCDPGSTASGPNCTGSGLLASNGNCSNYGSTAGGCTNNGTTPG